MTVVLDASALLALLKGEPGAEAVAAALGDAVISAVNLQEVLKDLLRDDRTLDEARAILAKLPLIVRPHDQEAAFAAAALVGATQRFGRGLGDRTCMALGITLGVPVLTADRAWRRVEIDGLDLRFIR